MGSPNSIEIDGNPVTYNDEKELKRDVREIETLKAKGAEFQSSIDETKGRVNEAEAALLTAR